MSQSIEDKAMADADVSDYTTNEIIVSNWIAPWSKGNRKNPLTATKMGFMATPAATNQSPRNQYTCTSSQDLSSKFRLNVPLRGKLPYLAGQF
jgi:hypothetical protein